MDYGIRNRVALVGGGSQGIGRAAAEALAREGVKVAICARREQILNKAASELRESTGGEILPIVADLAVAADCQQALAKVRDTWGPVDILVTNTGGPRPGRFADLKEADWDQAYALLIKSALCLISGVLPGMKERKWGRIIGVTSVSVKEPIANLILSNVFRAGVTSLFKTLSGDVARDGITVNTVLPGLTDTERLRELYGGPASGASEVEAAMAKVGANLPLGRLTRASELGEVIAFLASEAGSAVTGTALGGRWRAAERCPLGSGRRSGLFPLRALRRRFLYSCDLRSSRASCPARRAPITARGAPRPPRLGRARGGTVEGPCPGKPR
jgi:3-oxoacyl-[acyl-carrier protein] reductase